MDRAPEHLHQELSAIVDAAWRLFDVPRPASHQVCTNCCLSPEHDRAFFNQPVRALSDDWVIDWWDAAFHAPIAPELARYLAPRILQALVSGLEPMSGLELALQRLRTGDGAWWTAAERDLLRRFQQAFLDTLRERSGKRTLDDVLCMFIEAGHPRAAVLACVDAWPDRDLVTRLNADWCNHYPSIWQTTFWTGDNGRFVLDWYTSQAMQDRLIAFSLSDDATAYDVTRASAVLACICGY